MHKRGYFYSELLNTDFGNSALLATFVNVPRRRQLTTPDRPLAQLGSGGAVGAELPAGG